MMQFFANPKIKKILKQNRLTHCDNWWQLPLEWVEPPSFRKGVSGVCVYKLPVDHSIEKVYVKKQENYFCFSFRPPFFRQPTLRREIKQLNYLAKHGVTCVTPLFYHEAGKRAVLVTQALENFYPLTDWFKQALTFAKRRQLMHACAKAVSACHQAGIMHNALYPKHLFIKKEDTGFKVALIDCEKAKWRPIGLRGAIRDLESLNFHSFCQTRTTRLLFFKAYLKIDKLNPDAKVLWRRVVRLSAKHRKGVKHATKSIQP